MLARTVEADVASTSKIDRICLKVAMLNYAHRNEQASSEIA